MSSRKTIYLIAAIVGAVVPYIFFGRFIAAEGVNLPLFVRGLFANGAAGGFSADLLISSFIFWYWAAADAKERNVRNWWWIIPANLLVGLSLALPLYLYMREK